MGLLTKLFSTPSRIRSIVLGKALAASVRGVFQSVVIFALALVLGVRLRSDVLDIAGVFLVIVPFAICFSSLSMVLASFFRTRDRMMGIGQAVTIPLFFGSNAIYPVSLMPIWLRFVSEFNPQLRRRRDALAAPYRGLWEHSSRYVRTYPLDRDICRSSFGGPA